MVVFTGSRLSARTPGALTASRAAAPRAWGGILRGYSQSRARNSTAAASVVQSGAWVAAATKSPSVRIPTRLSWSTTGRHPTFLSHITWAATESGV